MWWLSLVFKADLSRSSLCRRVRYCTWLMDECMNKWAQSNLWCPMFHSIYPATLSTSYSSPHSTPLSASFYHPLFPHQLPFFCWPPSPSSPRPPPPPPPPPSLLHQGSCGLSQRQTNEGPRRAAPALPHITHSLSQSHTHAHGTCQPLSHASSASVLSW